MAALDNRGNSPFNIDLSLIGIVVKKSYAVKRLHRSFFTPDFLSWQEKNDEKYCPYFLSEEERRWEENVFYYFCSP